MISTSPADIINYAFVYWRLQRRYKNKKAIQLRRHKKKTHPTRVLFYSNKPSK